MILLHLLVLISPAYGLFCEDRWMFFGINCYKRFEAAPSDYVNTCRIFKSVLVENVTASEAEFFTKITVGGPMGSGKGDFICKKPAASKDIFTPRTRPHPRNELDCSGDPQWFGLNETKRCYSMQFSHQPLTWDQANTRCQNLFSGTLATMKTELEYNHVINVGHFGTYALTYEQPLVGYRKTGNEWKWVDGTQGGITLFHGGIPDPKLNLNCVQLSTDITIQPDHQSVYNGVFGRMIPIPCNQRFQRYICSVDHTTFVRKFPGVATTTNLPTTTTSLPTTTTTSTCAPPAQETYCPARWLKYKEGCYRIYQMFKPFDCVNISGANLEVPVSSPEALFQQIHEWTSYSDPGYPMRVCFQPTSNNPPVYEPTLPPRNDFDCFFDGWTGFNKTGKCYKTITDPFTYLNLQQMRSSCQILGGSLAHATDYMDDQDFIAQVGHLGVTAFYSELPALDDINCGAVIRSDEMLFDPDDYYDDDYWLGKIDYRSCILSNSYICEVDYEKMKQRHGK